MSSKPPVTASRITLQLSKNKSNQSSRRSSTHVPTKSINTAASNDLSSSGTNDPWDSDGQTHFEYFLDRKEQHALPRRATIIPYITLTNASPLLNPELLSQEKMRDGRQRRVGSRGTMGGSRGSLPFTPSLNIPEAIPEVVMPRRQSDSVSNDPWGKQQQQQQSGEVTPTSQTVPPFSGSDKHFNQVSSALARSYSPLRPSDLVVPCSDTFEQVLKNMERDHARQFVADGS